MTIPEKPSEHVTDSVDVAAWQKRYRDGRTGWDRGQPNQQLLAWLDDEIWQDTHFVVPGCGYGHEVMALAERGLRVTGIDFAEIPVHALRQRLADASLSADIRLADIFTTTFDEPVDVVIEQTCLCAIDPSRRPEYESQLARWLRPGGRLMAFFMQTHRDGGPPFHCDMLEMRELFSVRRWAWPSRPAHEVPHPSGLFELAVELQRR